MDKFEAIYVTTGQLAEFIGRSPNHIRNYYHRDGHFWNVKPVKTPGGGLIWPIQPFEQFKVCKVSFNSLE